MLSKVKTEKGAEVILPSAETKPKKASSKKSKEKPEIVPLTKRELEGAMDHISQLNTKIDALQEELKEYCKELKEKGVNVPILKKVCLIQESDDYDTFSEYWGIYEDDTESETK